uniref:CCHC-type domain-containing protein n=1 Tax=Fagus sylvatica TaxID=28930 RepID=A0A2N9ISI0_FAGSY
MESIALDSQDPSKRKWTPAEDIKLVEALVEYHQEIEGSPENKFKSGYLKVLEGKLSTKLPNCGLRAKPHVESRLRTLKREFQILHDMLTGPNTIGFGWDNVRKCVTVENDVWDAYVQGHKGAGSFRNKSFPLYEELCIVYAKDHATGKDAQTPADVIEELEIDIDDTNHNVGNGLDGIHEDVSCTQIPTTGGRVEGISARKRKKKGQNNEDNMMQVMKEVASMLGSQLKDASDNLSKAVIGTIASENSILTMEKLVEKKKKLGWSKELVRLEVDLAATERSELLLLGKVLSPKSFSRMVVKEIVAKAWNTVHEVEVSAVDRNVFLFTFQHEVDVRRIWDRRPWSFEGEHVILKQYDPEGSLHEVDFSVSDFWVQIHGLPLNRQNEQNVKKIGKMLGSVLEVDIAGSRNGLGTKYVRVRASIDVNTPLITGFPLGREQLPVLWIPFKYERLGSFCYGCGLLGHEIRSCSDVELQQLWKEGKSMGVYGSWLRAESSEYQPGIDLDGLMSSDMAECSRISIQGTQTEQERQESMRKQRQLTWGKVTQLAKDTWKEIEQQIPMDQSKSWVETAKDDKEGEVGEVVMGCREPTRLIGGLVQSINLENAEPTAQLGNVSGRVTLENPVQSQLGGQVGPNKNTHNEVGAKIEIGPINVDYQEPKNNHLTLSGATIIADTYVGRDNYKKKAVEDFADDHQSKRAKEEPSCLPHIQNISPAPKKPHSPVKSKGKGKALLIKTQAQAKLGEKIRKEVGREIPNDVYVQGLEADEGMFLPSVAPTVRSLKALSRSEEPDVFFVAETKVKSPKIDRLKLSMGYANCFCVNNVGKAGGLALFWKLGVELEVIFSNNNVIASLIYSDPPDTLWLLISVHGPPYIAKRKKIWALMAKIISGFSGHWLLIGDLNSTVSNSDKSGGRQNGESSSRSFQNFISEVGAIDLGFNGSKFTWSNNRAGWANIRERLDRGLYNVDWQNMFPKAGIRHLVASNSDHKPILLDTHLENSRGRRPFRFEAMWARDECSIDVVERAWWLDVEGSQNFKLLKKCQNTRKEFIAWNKSCFGIASTRIKELENKLKALQELASTQENIKIEVALHLELNEWLEREELKWKQKSRDLWLKEGDRNSKFFHASTLTAHPQIPQDLEGLMSPCISDAENMELACIPSPQEIKAVIWAMHPLKASGPDGFPVLSRLINREVESGNLKGVKIAPRAPPISKLLYADDVLLFCGARVWEVGVLMGCVDKYCKWSGQAISMEKSGFFVSKGVHGQFSLQIRNQWGFKKLAKDVKYLGLPLFLSPNKSKDFSFVKEKLEAHVSGWKCKSLSWMGRATLIKSVAQATPIYGMSAFKFPKRLCEEMDAIVRKFWWNPRIEGNKYFTPKAWADLCSPLSEGGLAFPSVISVLLVMSISFGCLSAETSSPM